MNDQPTYIAFDGIAYAWPPPEGWLQDGDGRWWPPSEESTGAYPGPLAAAQPRRPWWQKKRFLIPLGVIGLLVVVGALSEPAEDSATEAAAESSVPETAAAPSATTVLAVVEGDASSVPTEETVGLSETEIEEMANVLAFRLIASEVVPGIADLSDEQVEEFGQSMCDVARQAGSADELGAVLLVTWADFDQGTRDVFGNDPTNMAQVTGAALGAFCPEELERLGLN